MEDNNNRNGNLSTIRKYEQNALTPHCTKKKKKIIKIQELYWQSRRQYYLYILTEFFP